VLDGLPKARTSGRTELRPGFSTNGPKPVARALTGTRNGSRTARAADVNPAASRMAARSATTCRALLTVVSMAVPAG
jgi:hypothetical protein